MSIRETIHNAVKQTEMVQIALPRNIADDLACYLDDEEVFSDVVDILLKAIPLPVPPAPPEQPVGPHAEKTFLTYYDNLKVLPAHKILHQFMADNPQIDKNGSVPVFQVMHKKGATLPILSGYNLYGTNHGRYWYDNNTTLHGYDLVGYYHPTSGTFCTTNDGMISWLLQTGYIKP